MSIKRAHVGVVVAILAAAGAGFVVARATSPSASAPADAQADEDKAVHVKGFVALKPADAPAAGVELAQVERGGGIDLLLPGRVAVAVNAQSVVAAPLDGTIVDIHVAVGSKVAKGAAIASIRSPEGGAIRAEVDAAKAALEAAEALDVRNKHLFDEGVIPRQEWEATRAATLTAQAQVRAAESQAAAMGAPTTRGVAVIRSPISGVVTRIPATPGSVLDDGMEIATVVDVSKTELAFDAPPASVNLIALGSPGRGALDRRRCDRRRDHGVAPASRALVERYARIIGSAPPPGTAISGRLVGGSGNVLTVPSESVQTVESAPSVFVAEADGFRTHTVVPGNTSNGRTEIISGLTGDEQIAGKGAFLLKAELGKSQAEHDH
ncbi:MAG: efflux RND transporter periplasmic adaptor subunit [Hyphomonadaceae bacterium]|nr:efflux RND transporter periplasmic adaptor subunit [Hyphomonadaceae bacterium]